MKMTYIKPDSSIMNVDMTSIIMAVSMGGDTGYYPGGIIEGDIFIDEE